MAKKKTELDKAVDRAAKLIQSQVDTLPTEAAKKKLRELEAIAAKAYRTARLRGKDPQRHARLC